MHMSLLVLLLFFLPIQYSVSIHNYLFLNTSNCSLSFTVRTEYQSNKIQTDYPLEFHAHFHITCKIPKLTAYYKILPLEILVVGKYKHQGETIKSMVAPHARQFHFNINQSSTVRLCILSAAAAGDDDDDDNDNNHRICRQIHIGVSTLDHFWDLPRKILYICLICLVGTPHIIFVLREKWRTSGKKVRSTVLVVKPLLTSENKHDTFENEKVHDEMSGAEDDE